MASTYDRIETENALLDEMIYNCKLIMRSLIIKDEAKALSFETKENITMFDTYRAIVEGRITLYYFEDITADDIKASIPGLTNRQVTEYLDNIYKMPVEYRTALLKYLSDKFIQEYDEPNDYYRLISGMPPSDQPEIYLTEEDISSISSEIDISKPLHKLSDNEISIIQTAGVIDKLKEKYPEATYLNYIDKGITFYSARLANKYSILYITSEAQDEILSKFQELYNINRNIIIRTMDDVALKYYHELYDRFIMMTLVVNTVADMVAEFPDFFINREVFDIRTAEYFFTSFGVDFYKDIPMKYQKRLIRNLNKLIKYKGTSKNIINITKIFGFDNIDIYKYYLNKSHVQRNNIYDQKVIGEAGDIYTFPGYVNNANSNENYELQFIRVPLNELVNNYLKDEESIFSYDEFIQSNGEYWDGDKDHEVVKKEILEMEFNTLITQFMSVSTNNSMTDINMQITYFINMLMYYGIDPRNMVFSVPGIDSRNSTFNIFDSFVFIYALMYLYIGFEEDEETIITDPSLLADIYGFDLYANLDQLLSDVENDLAPLILAEQEAAIIESDSYIPYDIESLKSQIGATIRSVGIGPYANVYIDIAENIFSGTNKFVTFGKGIAPTIQQMVNAYTTNKGIHDYIERKMIESHDIYEYKIYRDLYDALMVVTLNNDLFKIIDKNGNSRTAKSYIEYLKYNNPRYYSMIRKILSLKGTDEFKTTIYDQINNVCDCTISYIESDELLQLFSDLPIDTVDYIKMYMIKIIEFFMSFKITIIDSQSINKLNPERNRLCDHTFITAHYYMNEENRLKDSAAILASFGFRDINRQDDTIIVRAVYE